MNHLSMRMPSTPLNRYSDSRTRNRALNLLDSSEIISVACMILFVALSEGEVQISL